MNIDQLKQVIQAANPELVRGFVTRNGNGEKIDDTVIPTREIRLADVLLAIDKRYDGNHFATAASNGWLHFEGIRGFWNLKEDSLDKQSPETIEFLTNLLCRND